MNNLTVSQFKEEPNHSPDMKEVLEEEEEKVALHDDVDIGSDFEYFPEDKEVEKPTMIKILKRTLDKRSGGENEKIKKRFTCEHCGKQFVQKQTWRRHVQIEHEGMQVTKLRCDQCNFTSAYQNYLKHHIKTVHEGVRTHLCDKCDYKAATKGVLIKHIETIHDGIRYQCDQCEHQASNKDSLKKHIYVMHSGVKLHCDQCNYQTAQKINLDTHIRSVHEGIRVTCDECGLQVVSENNLKKHMKVHAKREKTEKCPKCDKMFYTSRALKKHDNTVHGIKAFYCEVCVFKSCRLSNLNAHRKSHNKSKITKPMLINMVINGEHPFYTREDLPMIEGSTAD